MLGKRRINCFGDGEEGFLFKFPVGIDLTNHIIQQAVSVDIGSFPPILEIRQLAPELNAMGEVILFNRNALGSPRDGYVSNALAKLEAGPAAFRHEYRLRANVTHNDGFVGPSESICYGISHGSLGAQPWGATTAGTIAQLRIRTRTDGLTIPYSVELVYGPGGGVAWDKKIIGSAESLPGDSDYGVFLELVVNYPARRIEGWINGILLGSMKMTGWNGSREPNDDILGNKSWMSIFTASGDGTLPQVWYTNWIAMEMGMVLNQNSKIYL